MKKTEGRKEGRNLPIVITSRNTFMDCVKGIAIFLVIWGHCLHFTINILTDGFDVISKAIYLFHMPLFMALSGYFFDVSIHKHTLWDLALNKIISLEFPNLFWTFIPFIIRTIFLILCNKSPAINLKEFTLLFGGFWFLSALLSLSLIGILGRKILPGRLNFLHWTLCFILLHIIPSPFKLPINALRFLLPFFFLGQLFSSFQWSKIPYWMIVPSLFVFAFSYQHFDFNTSMYMMTNDIWTLTYHQDACLRFIGGLSGILIVLISVRFLFLILSVEKLKFLSWIGQHTLPLYVIHECLLSFLTSWLPHSSSPSRIDKLQAFLLALVLTLLSLTLYKVLSQKRILALICFGERRAQNYNKIRMDR